MSKRIGIDLGTTNCVVSYINDEGEVEFIPNKDNEAITPTAIHLAYNADGKIVTIVGKRAKELAKTEPDRVLMSFKTKMGTSQVVMDMGDRKITALTASYLMLRYLKSSAEEYLQEKVYDAIISVPAYFTESQVEATRVAAEMAGLHVDRILIEPTAAAIYYGVNAKDKEKVIAVYDLGGGTFDISLISILGDTSMVLGAPNGDSKLGGDDIDRAITDYVISQNSKNKVAVQTSDRLVRLCELAKIELCDKIAMGKGTSVIIEAPELGIKPVELTQKTFEKLCDPLVQRTIECFKSALEDASLTAEDLDEVVLVGGSSRIPYIRECLVDFLKIPKFNLAYFETYSVDPDLAVGLGCGIFSQYLEEANENKVTDVISKSIGIEEEYGKMQVILNKGSIMPARGTYAFTNSVDNQEYANLKVYEGDNTLASRNHLLGSVRIQVPKGPKNTQRVLVKINISKNGTLEVKAVSSIDGGSLTIKRQFETKEDVSWLSDSTPTEGGSKSEIKEF